MSIFLNHAWLLTAGPAGLPGIAWGTEIPGVDPDRALLIEFEVVKTSRRGSNKATIKLHNLSPISIGLLEIPGTIITLSVGYRGVGAAFGNLGLVFTGDIARRGVTSVKEGTDRITTIEAGDAELVLQDTRSDISLAPGSTTTQALSLLLASMLVGPGNALTLPPIPFAMGFNHFGLARDALTEIADMYQASWSIQDRQLYILRSGEVAPGDAVLLSSLTGLIGSPKKTKNGIEARSLIQPTLNPGKIVSIVSTIEVGFYKIKETTYRGASRSSDWYADIKGQRLEVAI